MMFPLTMISVRENIEGCYNLPRYIIYVYIYIYEPGPRAPTPPPSPPKVSPPTPNPPTPPQNLVFACYLHIYIHIYTYILPFPPLQPRISTLFAALESHDLVNGPCLPVYFYHNLFFRTAYSVPRTWFTTYLLPMDYAKLTYANLDICTVENNKYIYAHSRYYILIS